MNNVEIIMITTCGTYPCWIDHTVGSIYNHVDKIIVVNSGYNIKFPEDGAIYPLERESTLLKQIDVDNKIIEITPNEIQLRKLFSTSCNRDKDEFGRATNITLATETAFNYKKDIKPKERWILKADSDQIFYKFKREDLENLINTYTSSGFRFAQYSDYIHDFEHIGYIPDDFTNDGAMFYRALPHQRYGAQGSPDTHVDQYQIYSIRTSHMRRISPKDVPAYEYFFKRLWYHTWGPNSIMEHDYNRKTGKKLTKEEIFEIANKGATSIIENEGRKISELAKDVRIPYNPPEICTMTPLEYINKGL